MGPTARELGLTVNTIVDDRRDPVASTSAALDYLEDLYEEFDSWLLALAAYNGGPGRVRRALGRVGLGEGRAESGRTRGGDERFLEIRPHLPRETREFIPRFLAAAALAESPEVHGFSLAKPDPMAYDEVSVPDATSLDVVATAAEVSEDIVRQLNPHYLRGYTPPGQPRTVRVPAGAGPTFQSNFATVPAEERLSFLEHIVSSGETFTHIARTYGVRASELSDMNRHVDPRRLQIGMSVMVPLSGSSRGNGLHAGADD